MIRDYPISISELIYGDIIETLPDINSILYLDEIYSGIMKRLFLLGSFIQFEDWFINEYDEATYYDFESLLIYARSISSFGFSIEPQLSSVATTIKQTIVTASDVISAEMTSTELLLSKVEAALSRRASMSSIYDEVIVYDSFTADTLFNSFKGCAVDTSTGMIILNPANIQPVGFQRSLSMNRKEGLFPSTMFGKRTEEILSGDYFFGRTYSFYPRINAGSSIDALTDNDVTTAYEIEYNSIVIDSQGIIATITITPSSATNILSISCMVPSHESTIGISPYRIECTKCIVNDKDITETLIDNRIRSSKISIGSLEPIWSSSDSSFAEKKYSIPTTTSPITLTLQSKTPQSIIFPEMVFYAPDGSEVKRLNYFETLVAQKVQVPEGTIDPLTFFSEKERAIIHAQANQQYYASNVESNQLYRYSLGLREIQLYLASYETQGTIVSANLNQSKRPIATVELFVAMHVPDMTSVSFALSTDGKKWYDIAPANMVELYDLPSKLVFSSYIALQSNDKFISTDDATNIYVTIYMKGTGSTTPIIRSIALRIKYDTYE